MIRIQTETMCEQNILQGMIFGTCEQCKKNDDMTKVFKYKSCKECQLGNIEFERITKQ